MQTDQAIRARKILTGIAAASWEHPADRAALQALRRVPPLDTDDAPRAWGVHELVAADGDGHVRGALRHGPEEAVRRIR